MPGGVIRIIPGDNPPATTLAEYYEVPFNEPKAAVNGFGPRGADIDRKGVVWIPSPVATLQASIARNAKAR